ncbi:MAG TPA: aminotransferase class I/II-fold pyridoxal phosphate-dependent enzyme [Acidimicrobiia bacterium]|nr:aminotransferase class I/II-fold pyridoxal phosphate-dependent enzyme [Acidimicrobiia bacterium]
MRRNPVLDDLGGNPVTRVQDLARDMRARGLPLVDFSIGDPREPTPPFIVDALRSAVPSVSQYPTTRGTPELRAAISGYVRRRFGVHVDPATQVMPTTGSKEAIFSTPLAFVDRAAGDSIVWATPGYPIYERGARLAGARGVAIPMSGDFVFRPGDIAASEWASARIVWVCSPHNPTGSVTPAEVLAEFVERCRQADSLLCADECYADLYEDEAPASVLEVAGEGSRGVLSFLSLSKRSGMTGYRTGAIVGDPEAIAALAMLRTATGTAAPEYTQAAAAAAWSDDVHAADRRAVFTAKRRILRNAFTAAGLEVVGSDAGLYVWLEVDDDLVAAERLLEAGIVVSPGRAFGPGGEGHLRLALVPTVDECEAAAAQVIAVLAT